MFAVLCCAAAKAPKLMSYGLLKLFCGKSEKKKKKNESITSAVLCATGLSNSVRSQSEGKVKIKVI